MITDETTCLQKLVLAINKVPVENLGQNKTLADKISYLLEIESSSAEFWMFLTTINERLISLEEFYSEVKDNEFPEQSRAIILNNLKSLKNSFSLSSMNVRVDIRNPRPISENNLNYLSMNISFLRRHRPLVELSEAQKDSLLDAIDKIEISEGQNESIIIILTEALSKLKFLIKNAEWFGQKPIISQLVYIKTVSESVPEDIELIVDNEGRPLKYYLYAIILTAATIFTLPHNIQQAHQNYLKNPHYSDLVNYLATNSNYSGHLPEPIKPLALPDLTKLKREEE